MAFMCAMGWTMAQSLREMRDKEHNKERGHERERDSAREPLLGLDDVV